MKTSPRKRTEANLPRDWLFLAMDAWEGEIAGNQVPERDDEGGQSRRRGATRRMASYLRHRDGRMKHVLTENHGCR